MATIVGAIATSHTPTIGFAKDRKLQDDPVWAPIFEAYEPIKAWLAEKKPDVLFVIYNDHITSFFFDHYSAFVLGVDEAYAPADEGGGPRDLPPIKGHAALARHIGTSLMADEFDMSFFRNKPIDHGCFSPLSMLADPSERWPWSIVPLQVGVLQFPIPTAARCLKLGRALRKAIESYPEALKVALVATGGLSHQVHGERCGFNNPEWDATFLDLLEADPESLSKLTHAEYAKLGGLEGAEVIMWLVMRGAMAPKLKRLHRTYYLPSMTGIATAIYEDDEVQPPVAAFVDRQTAGIGELEGTYPFTLERAGRAYALNAFLHDLIRPEVRAAFAEAPDRTMVEAGLTAEERRMVEERDWRALIHHGAIFFGLEKLAAVSGIGNIAVYAAMRGQSVEDFQKTRAAAITYGVGR
jgi:gallate dioxygenase